MVYDDFNLQTALERFELTTVEDVDLFVETAEVEPGPMLTQTLDEWATLALAMNTEKARSEMIIAPILMEVVRQLNHRISLHSGISFDVDRDRGLNGECDVLLAPSPEIYFLDQPVVALVEAVKEDMIAGLGQCVAALVVAQTFNAKGESRTLEPVHGAVTTGNNWRFVKLEGSTVSIDKPEYHLSHVRKILANLIGVAG